jgi:hypothetical protein
MPRSAQARSAALRARHLAQSVESQGARWPLHAQILLLFAGLQHGLRQGVCRYTPWGLACQNTVNKRCFSVRAIKNRPANGSWLGGDLSQRCHVTGIQLCKSGREPGGKPARSHVLGCSETGRRSQSGARDFTQRIGVPCRISKVPVQHQKHAQRRSVRLLRPDVNGAIG